MPLAKDHSSERNEIERGTLKTQTPRLPALDCNWKLNYQAACASLHSGAYITQRTGASEAPAGSAR